MYAEGFSRRLRELRNRNDWTVQEMAERSGVPKRTLDKYMQKENPAQPGLDAIVMISKGLGVSLDWLLMGAETTATAQSALTRVSAYAAALPFMEAILALKNGGLLGDDKETLGGDTAKGWAWRIAEEAGKKATGLAMNATPQETIRIAELALQGGEPTKARNDA